jgi:hypothetical protein
MIINEILIEKYRVQKKLSENSNDMHDYFKKAHESAEQLNKRYGMPFRYQRLPNKASHRTSR